MKRLMSAILSAIIAFSTFATAAVYAADVNTNSYISRYNILLEGDTVTVEREVLEQVQKSGTALTPNLSNKLRVRSATCKLSPSELVELAFCGSPTSEKDAVFSSLKGEKAIVSYLGDGVITIEEDPNAPTEIELLAVRPTSRTYAKYSSAHYYFCVADAIRTNVRQKVTFEEGKDSNGRPYVRVKGFANTQSVTQSKANEAKLKTMSTSSGGTVYSGKTWGKMKTKIYCASDPNGKVLSNTIYSNSI